MPALPEADEPHVVPSGYWKVVLAEVDGELRAAAFIMGQDAARSAPLAHDEGHVRFSTRFFRFTLQVRTILTLPPLDL